jgi:hypothetical protein
MSSKGLQVLLTVGILTIGSVAGPSQSLASRFYHHRATRYSGCCLRAYPYAVDAGRSSARLVAVAPPGPPSGITHYLPSRDASGKRQAVSVQRKDFPVKENSVTADGVTLARVGLSLYDTGQYACTGLLQFDGGPDGSLLGANVVVRVRAYAGAPQHPGGLTNMRLLWETEQPIWVHRGEAKTISLLPEPPQPPFEPAQPVRVRLADTWPRPPSGLVYQHFDEITNLEIVLEHCKDR